MKVPVRIMLVMNGAGGWAAYGNDENKDEETRESLGKLVAPAEGILETFIVTAEVEVPIPAKTEVVGVVTPV